MIEKIERDHSYESDDDLIRQKMYIPKVYPKGNKTVKIAMLIHADTNFDEVQNMFIYINFLAVVGKLERMNEEKSKIIIYCEDRFKDRINLIVKFLVDDYIIKTLPETYLDIVDGIAYIGEDIDMEFARDIKNNHPEIVIYATDWKTYEYVN